MNKSKATLAAALLLASMWTAQSKELTASMWLPETHPLTSAGFLALSEDVKARSGGDLTIKVFTGGTVLPPSAHLSGLQDGIVDMTYHAGTYTPSDLPQDNMLATFGIGMDDTMATALAVTDFYMTDPAMQEMFSDLNIVFLAGYASPQYYLMCTSNIASLDDIKGKKLRLPGPVHASWAESVGAVPINVPSSEMFSGLEKGQLDCGANAITDLRARSLWDVTEHATMLPLGTYFAGWQYAISDASWDSLSLEHRKLLFDALPSNIVSTTLIGLAIAAEVEAEARERGYDFVEPETDLADGLKSFLDNDLQGIAASTGETLGVSDIAGLSGRFMATYEKWQSLLANVPADDEEAIAALLQDEVYSKIDPATYGD